MSNALINDAWEARCSGGPAAKVLLVRLADRAGDDSKCWPGQTRLSQDCQLSVGAVRKHIKSLVRDGHISIEQLGWSDADGGNMTTTYRVHPLAKPEPVNLKKLIGSEIWELPDKDMRILAYELMCRAGMKVEQFRSIATGDPYRLTEDKANTFIAWLTSPERDIKRNGFKFVIIGARKGAKPSEGVIGVVSVPDTLSRREGGASRRNAPPPQGDPLPFTS